MNQFRKNLLLLIPVIFLLFISCNNEDRVFKKLTGTLVIEEIEYKGERYNDSLMVNILFFRKSKTNHPLVIIPETTEYEKETALCYLTREKNDFFLKIDSENEVFNGTYLVNFFKNDERKLLGVELLSNDLTIKAYYSHKDYFLDRLNW